MKQVINSLVLALFLLPFCVSLDSNKLAQQHIARELSTVEMLLQRSRAVALQSRELQNWMQRMETWENLCDITKARDDSLRTCRS